MVEQNEVIFDGRIPPRGFVVRPDLAPVGREFEELGDGTLAHWDLAPFEMDIPADVAGPIAIEARLLYQTTTREFVEFLRDENYTDNLGQEMYDLWVKYGRDEPHEMERAIATFDIGTPPPAPLRHRRRRGRGEGRLPRPRLRLRLAWGLGPARPAGSRAAGRAQARAHHLKLGASAPIALGGLAGERQRPPADGGVTYDVSPEGHRVLGSYRRPPAAL